MRWTILSPRLFLRHPSHSCHSTADAIIHLHLRTILRINYFFILIRIIIQICQIISINQALKLAIDITNTSICKINLSPKGHFGNIISLFLSILNPKQCSFFIKVQQLFNNMIRKAKFN